jgi:5-formyltetrahydrofolate cyclo-ligase
VKLSVETGNSTLQSLNSADKETLLMLLPGLAFDLGGNRIGYGAGYYDRYLSKHQKDHFLKVALAYDFQVYDHLEADEFDIRADLILTPTRLISCIEMQDK